MVHDIGVVFRTGRGSLDANMDVASPMHAHGGKFFAGSGELARASVPSGSV
jgi:hypothetical protein